MPPAQQPAPSKSVLYVEAKAKASASRLWLLHNPDAIEREICKWLHDNHLEVQVGQHLEPKSLASGKLIHSLDIAGCSKSRTFPDRRYHVLAENHLDIAVYGLHDEDDESACEDEDGLPFSTIALPNRSLDGLWETLVFEEPIPEYLLRTIIRMISLSEDPRLGPADMCWHNLILLHGPPGSGKSTLAKGLAQKLSIRLASVYPVTKFIEVKSHALLSKFFGESGKLVGKLFDAIVGASVDDNLLTVVLIDEVESLAASRAKASQANDISDAIRSTNELLRGIDKLRSRPNVVLVCTSNLIENMDLAFVDRCGVKQYVGEPNFEAAYEIVRSVINKLIKTGLVYFTLTMDCGQECGSNSQSTNISSNSYPSQLDEVSPSLESESPNLTEDLNSIPELAWARLQLSHHGNTTAAKLESISQLATGLSGRTLRRLPWLALARYTVDEPCSLAELLTALEKVVLEEAQSSTPEETESKVDEELTKKGHAGSVQDQTSSDTDDLLAHEMEGILKDMTRLGGL